jgi:hypothetical protein
MEQMNRKEANLGGEYLSSQTVALFVSQEWRRKFAEANYASRRMTRKHMKRANVRRIRNAAKDHGTINGHFSHDL